MSPISFRKTKAAIVIFGLAFAMASCTSSRQAIYPTILTSTAAQISEHVFSISDECRAQATNVGFKATLIIDPGLETKKDSIVLGETRFLSNAERLQVVTTHTTPEYDLGAIAFPEEAAVTRSFSRQNDVGVLAMGLADWFKTFSDRTSHTPDYESFIRNSYAFFGGHFYLDLGEVTVRLIETGPACARGDVVIFIVEDSVLFTGNLMMNEFLNPTSPISSIEGWPERLDQLKELQPKIIVSAHYKVG